MKFFNEYAYVQVVIGKTEKIKGNVFEMSLMHTTILTRHNEKLRIPNHQLFHEHITNLSEGLVSTFEIPIVFALDGPLRCPQEKIHTFIRRVKQFAKVDHKEDWIDVIVFCDAMDYSVNQAKYTFWCTHRASYHEVRVVEAAMVMYARWLRCAVLLFV